MTLAMIWKIWLAFVQVVYGIVGGFTGGIAGAMDEFMEAVKKAIFG